MPTFPATIEITNSSNRSQSMLTYKQARELVLAIIRISLIDLESSDPAIKNTARDWLIHAGFSLAEEVRAGITIATLKNYIHETERGEKRKKRIMRFHRNAYGNQANE